MIHTGDLSAIELFAILVGVAAVLGIVTSRLSWPLSVAMVLAGLAAGALVPPGVIEVTPELILAVLIPGLVFEAAYKLDLPELRRTSGIVAVLAVPGVVVTAGFVAAIAALMTGLDPGLGFLLGAMLSATDPVAVIDLLKRVRAPDRLTTVVDAEALLNDGTGVVLAAIALAALTQPVGPVDGVLQFVVVVAASIAFGAVAGYLGVRLMALTDDHLVQTLISIVAAYGTFLVAVRFEGSGIIATVSAGIALGWARRQGWLGEDTMAALDDVWDFAAYMLTALTFLLIGIALALALPLDLAERDLLAGAVYGIVLITILFQGTTAGWLARRVGVAVGARSV